MPYCAAGVKGLGVTVEDLDLEFRIVGFEFRTWVFGLVLRFRAWVLVFRV